jgi:hypothetical protein
MPKASKEPVETPAPKQRSTNEILLVIVQALENVHHPNSTDALREITVQLTPAPAPAE